MVMSVATPKKVSPEERKKLLKALVYESTKSGKVIYYRDYEKVLRGELTLEGVIGSSELQAVILALIITFLKIKLGKDFVVAGGELGFFTGTKRFRSLDIAVFNKSELSQPSDKYTRIPPKAVIEIDTKADLSKYGSFEEYMLEKTQELLDAGVEKVVWYITRVKKVMVAQKGKDWITKDWNSDIEVLEGVRLNLEKLLKEEGIKI
ncbi:Uma2 family endonuclease [Hydrogenivirga sp.]